MKRVRNKSTGLIHEVNDDHWALSHPDYEVLEDEPEPHESNEPNELKRKRKEQ